MIVKKYKINNISLMKMILTKSQIKVTIHQIVSTFNKVMKYQFKVHMINTFKIFMISLFKDVDIWIIN